MYVASSPSFLGAKSILYTKTGSDLGEINSYLTDYSVSSDISKNVPSYLLVIVNNPALPDNGFNTLLI